MKKILLVILSGYSSVAFSMRQVLVKQLTTIQKVTAVGMVGFGAGEVMSVLAFSRANLRNEQCPEVSGENAAGFAAWAAAFNGVGFACSVSTWCLATKLKKLLTPVVASDHYVGLESSGSADSGEFPGTLDQED